MQERFLQKSASTQFCDFPHIFFKVKIQQNAEFYFFIILEKESNEGEHKAIKLNPRENTDYVWHKINFVFEKSSTIVGGEYASMIEFTIFGYAFKLGIQLAI